MSRSLWTLLAAAVLVLPGCTEDDVTPEMDREPPQVVVLYPPYQIDDLKVVEDSTVVYLRARDNVAVTELDLRYRGPTDTEPLPVGSTDRPISPSEVPDSLSSFIDLPEGWSLYSIWWDTRLIQNGTRPQLFARAIDTRGNIGVSDPVIVLILNSGGLLLPPPCDFTISPSIGTTLTEFVFDPRITRDPIDTDLSRIAVRWDFEGNGSWEIDWEDGATANDVQRWRYDSPFNYAPTLEARNTYVVEACHKPRTLPVGNPGGDPNPQEPLNYIEVPIGTFTVGTLDGSLGDTDEYPSHSVTFTEKVKIEKTEVKNRLYLNYLVAALDSTITFRNNVILRRDLVPPEDSAFVYLRLEDSRIFFNVDNDAFEIEPGFDDHPVTGVSWHGAQAYSLFYGLRLPYESEWEVACKGDSAAWNYPYGRSITDGDTTGTRRINYASSGDPFTAEGTTPVMFYDGRAEQGFQTIDTPSYFQLYDVSGNVGEWVADWYGIYPADPQTNPQGPFTGQLRVIRGGSYTSSTKGVRCTAREADDPLQTYSSVGFRTAFSVFE